MTSANKALPCPRDESALVEAPQHGVRAHECKRCHGIFIDANRVAGLKAQANCNRNVRRPVGQAHIYCPHDQDKLVPFTFRNVEVDVCFTCLGVWLDANEFEKVNVIVRQPKPNGQAGKDEDPPWFTRRPDDPDEQGFFRNRLDDAESAVDLVDVASFILRLIRNLAD